MAIEQLENLAKVGKLKAESPVQSEIDGLVRSAITRLKDADNTSLAIESRFDLAYNAAHAVSLAALRRHGYRSENRYIVFQALTHTVKLANEDMRVLDDAHRRRNNAEYEGEIDVTVPIVEAIIRVARTVEQRVAALGPIAAAPKKDDG